jgi:hypothetical protein
MFSSRRQVLRKRAWVKLGILSIVSITYLLAGSGSAAFSPAWLEPVQHALAQSATATPTLVPRPIPDRGVPADVESLPARPTIAASRPAHSAPSAIPTIAAKPLEPSAAVPAAPMLPTVPAASMHSPAGADSIATSAGAGGPALLDSWLELAPGVPAQPQMLDPGPLATSLPIAAEQHSIVQLPNTAAAPPSIGLMALLVGLALIIHGFRQVCRAAAQLERQGAALARLARLVEAEAQRRSRMDDRPAEAPEKEDRPVSHHAKPERS